MNNGYKTKMNFVRLCPVPFRLQRRPRRAAAGNCGLPDGYGNVEQPHAPQWLYGYHTGVSDRGDSPAGKRSDYGHPDEGGRCGT